jgi:hypothetical protein
MIVENFIDKFKREEQSKNTYECTRFPDLTPHFLVKTFWVQTPLSRVNTSISKPSAPDLLP